MLARRSRSVPRPWQRLSATSVPKDLCPCSTAGAMRPSPSAPPSSPLPPLSWSAQLPASLALRRTVCSSIATPKALTAGPPACGSLGGQRANLPGRGCSTALPRAGWRQARCLSARSARRRPRRLACRRGWQARSSRRAEFATPGLTRRGGPSSGMCCIPSTCAAVTTSCRALSTGRSSPLRSHRWMRWRGWSSGRRGRGCSSRT
mmetsp:Transcript_30413/g.97250  ORF Transcript_30413/g.97250 Transcript_30413/m.97250 type:complete len:205 (+) Transcript_30413:352-966(+)